MNLTDPTIIALNASILQTGSTTTFMPDPALQTSEPFLANGPEACATAAPSALVTLYNQMYQQAAYIYRI